jgi:hypothetical protein
MKEKIIISIVLVLALLGCRNPLTDHGEDYSSKIVAIYNDTSHHKLIFFGEEHDYIFSVDDDLASLIGAKAFLGYHLQRNSMVQDDLDLQIKILANGYPQLVAFILLDGSKLDQAQIDWIRNHGFEAVKKKTPDGNQQYAFNAQNMGARYDARGGESFDLLRPPEDGPIVLQGRDFSYTPHPSLEASPVVIEPDGIRYHGEHFTPSPL